MTYLQAIVIGAIQGLTELFPISSLGHTVLVPSWIGGTWATLVRQESSSESPYLAFVVGLHLATAVVLIGFYRRDWVRLIAAFFRTLAKRRVESADERFAWLIVIATVPVGILGLVLEHTFRTLFAKPEAAAIFLTVNGLILFAGERVLRARRAAGTTATEEEVADADLDERLSTIGWRSALWIGASQALALLAGISREGVAMVGGLTRGLTREEALRFAFMLSTPVILAAGVLKLPDLFGSLGDGVRGQVAAGSVAAVITSLFAVVFLARWFRTRTLTPFAWYCLLAGVASIVRFA